MARLASSHRRARRPDRRRRAARAEGRDARQALLDAAARVFSERGLGGASMDDVARAAGFSKGALYWHFAGKEELFFALLEERVDRPLREMIDLLETAPAEQDMAPEASRRFVELLATQRDLVLLDQEYWAQAVRDPKLRRRYAARQRALREALARALVARMSHLGGPPFETPAEGIATAMIALANGLALEKLVDASAVPDHLLGEVIVLIYRGLVASAA
jgi:AcrR family transcriptional regulator